LACSSASAFSFPDITAEGSITLGAAVAAVFLARGVNPCVATMLAVLAGSLAGATTGVLHTRFNINGLLSGILVMSALYSINLHVMGRSNIPLLSTRTLVTEAESVLASVLPGRTELSVGGWEISSRDAAVLLLSLAIAVAVGVVLCVFLRTDLGTAIRATGDNSQMIRALGVRDGNMMVLGLAISNGLIALAGALLSQYQGFSDVQMGIGMMVWGLASVIIGEALVGVKQLGLLITGAVMGSVLFRLLVAIALRWGLDPNDLKLITAVFVLLVLILPALLEKAKERKASHA
jgi:putative ABC transport system permease protein